jgi:hypothetical protein
MTDWAAWHDARQLSALASGSLDERVKLWPAYRINRVYRRRAVIVFPKTVYMVFTNILLNLEF